MSLSLEDKAWLQDQFRAVDASLTDRLRAADAAMTERIEAVETALLTEFHKWASPSEARQRTHTATLRAIDLEMETLSLRVTKLEDGHQRGQ